MGSSLDNPFRHNLNSVAINWAEDYQKTPFFICRVGDIYSEYAYEKSKMTQKKIEELHPEATKNRLGRLVDKDGKTVHIDVTELRVTEEEMGKIALDKVVDEFFEELKMELIK